MKTTRRCLLVPLLALGFGTLTSLTARAQSGPSGSVTNSVASPTNAVWDVDANLTSVHFTVTNKNDSTTVRISYPISLQQTGTGKIAGSGNSTVNLAIQGSNSTFTGSYKVTGLVSSSNGRGHAALNTVVTGMAQFDGHTRTLTGTHSTSILFDNLLGTVSGSEKSTASASGKGSISNHDTFTDTVSSTFPGNGSWTLVLNNLATDSKNRSLVRRSSP